MEHSGDFLAWTGSEGAGRYASERLVQGQNEMHSPHGSDGRRRERCSYENYNGRSQVNKSKDYRIVYILSILAHVILDAKHGRLVHAGGLGGIN